MVNFVTSDRTVGFTVAQIAREVVNKIDNENLRFVVGSRMVCLDEVDTLRVLSELSAKDKLSRVARAILIRSAYMCEKSAPYGAYLLCKRLAGDSCDIVDGGKLQPETFKRVATKLIGRYAASSFVEGLEHAGPLSTLSVHEDSKASYIEVHDSLEIPVSPIAEFGDKIELRDARFLSYDGVIERVSEINALLESSLSTESPVVIYARGFGYEVISTLLHNWKLDKLRVLPVSEHRTDVMNFYFKDLPRLTSVDIPPDGLQSCFEKLAVLSVVSLEKNVVSIRDKHVSKKSRQLIEELFTDKNIPQGATSYVTERARRLSSRRIEFHVGNDIGDAAIVQKDRINHLVRFILSARKTGVANISTCNNDISTCNNRRLDVPLTTIKIVEDTFRSIMLECNTNSVVVLDE